MESKHASSEGDLRKKIALLAKSQGLSQTELARKCRVSRLSIHRYFNGQTELRARDLLKLLSCLGIGIEQQIDFRLQESANNRPAPQDKLWLDVGSVLQGLEQPVQKTLLEQLSWWARMSSSPHLQTALFKLQNHIDQLPRSQGA